MHPDSALFFLKGGIPGWRRYVKSRYGQGEVPERISAFGFTILLHTTYTTGGLRDIGYLRVFEPETTALFRKILRKGMTVVDVGANIGWFSLLSARIVGRAGKVIAFEPESGNFELFSTSIRENQFQNVVPIRACAADYNGTTNLFISSEEPGLHSMVAEVSSIKAEVETLTLDSVLRDLRIDHVNLMKIDVEGAEPLVLKGAYDLLHSRSCDNIVMEWNEFAWRDQEGLLREVLDRYDLFKINRSPFLFKRLSEQELWRRRTWASGGRNLYLCIK